MADRSLSDPKPPRASVRPGNERRYDDDRCSMVLELRTPQLLVTRVRGDAREAMVDYYLREFLAFASLATHRIDVFHDWAEVASFEPGARQTFMRWGDERREVNKRLIRQVHILAGSTMVFLALGAARVVYAAQLEVYRLRESWDAALRDAEQLPSRDAVH